MAQESNQPISSLKHAQGLSRDGSGSGGCLGTAVPALTNSESGPSGGKPTERSSERKQPARASKRDIVFVRTHQLSLRGNAETEDTPSLRPFSRAMARATMSKVHL